MIITRWFLNTQKTSEMARGECSTFTNPKRGCCIFKKIYSSSNETLLTIGLMISHQKRSCWETGPVGASPWGWNTVVSGMFRSPFSTHFQWDKLPFSCFFTRGSLSSLAIAQWYHLSHVSAKKKGPETQIFTKIFQKRTADNFQAMFRQHLKASISGSVSEDATGFFSSCNHSAERIRFFWFTERFCQEFAGVYVGCLLFFFANLEVTVLVWNATIVSPMAHLKIVHANLNPGFTLDAVNRWWSHRKSFDPQ